MTDLKNFCQNCGYELEDGSNVCKRCNVVFALNLENFLLSKYKLLAIIGIFGALSVYLSTTAAAHGNNQFLQYGGYISLAIVILLSFICGWDLVVYSSKILIFPFDGKTHFITWLKLAVRFSTVLLFFSFFASVIFFISFYILTDVTIAEPLIYSIGIDFFLMITIALIYFPYRTVIEKSGNILRFLLNFILILLLIESVKQLFTESIGNPLVKLILNCLLIILCSFLIIRSSILIINTMNNGVRSLTLENLKKKLRQLWKH